MTGRSHFFQNCCLLRAATTSVTSRVMFLVVAVALLLTSSADAGEKRYIVRKNDTLSGIARRHGVKLGVILKRNRLSDPNRIFPGEVIHIPDGKSTSSVLSLNSSVRSALNRTRVQSRKWKYIVIHHSATRSGSAKGIDRYHREERHMENGLAYHFLIGNGRGMKDGEITIGNRWVKQLQGGHLASNSLNQKSIGICLVGNFDETGPTKKQIASLDGLTTYLLNRCRLKVSAVKTHKQINPVGTRCPGDRFPLKALLKELG